MIHLSSQYDNKKWKFSLGNIGNAIVVQTTVMMQNGQQSLSVVVSHFLRNQIILIYVNFRGQCIRHNH